MNLFALARSSLTRFSKALIGSVICVQNAYIDDWNGHPQAVCHVDRCTLIDVVSKARANMPHEAGLLNEEIRKMKRIAEIYRWSSRDEDIAQRIANNRQAGGLESNFGAAKGDGDGEGVEQRIRARTSFSEVRHIRTGLLGCCDDLKTTSIGDILASQHSPCIFRIRIRVSRVIPQEVCDCTKFVCIGCKRAFLPSMPQSLTHCPSCNNALRWIYILVFIVCDSTGSLEVFLFDDDAIEFFDSQPTDLRSNTEARNHLSLVLTSLTAKNASSMDLVVKKYCPYDEESKSERFCYRLCKTRLLAINQAIP